MDINEQNYLIKDEPSRFHLADIKNLLIHADKLDASDISIQSGKQVVAEIYGKLRFLTKRSLNNNEVGDIINSIYGANGTTQLSSGIDIDTNYEIHPSRGSRIRFRVNATACEVEGSSGIQITLRTIPCDPPTIESMDVQKEIFDNMSPQQGTVVLTGSTGSGKSTLLAAIIAHICKDPEAHRKVLTYESPIEFVYDRIETHSSLICQSEIPKHLPSFARGVRNALRRKPGLILVGEARDQETIAAVIEAALTGHPVYTTLHSNGVSDCVRRMVNAFPAEERDGRALDILETLKLVIWQKLVPTLDGKRVALREYLVFDDYIKDMLVQSPVEEISITTRKLLDKYGQPILVDAKKKYNDGMISKRTYNLFEERQRRMVNSGV